ncbi:nitroreductase family deazaflavin-dependent oxidoreductase [Mycolicibacterium fluoranthenivorans]|uniref:Nitroreductase family deazaflavin-dependent oxidoreductase n=1 Tax=Mycolicibacterium fluoranthenivorans TaxID=258505 RepID=A0A7G8PC21_9MYCO|nr:nitroreductase family deazaflavin-dependent oxidoreductase [Mycolicibacterium fluoranthenivorans]QNJ91887.1 nitroreductase family deazaflavin-dependent oxidoreductase [Mycolicibacterium fluoranthenivorans]
MVSPVEVLMRVIDRSWGIVRHLVRGHVWIYRLSGGRVGQHVPGVPSMLLLDHIGAKSGKRRTTPLAYMPDRDRYIIVAAKGGHPENPAWLYNLRARPCVTVQIGARRLDMTARELDPEEHRRLWPTALAYTSHWRRYARRVPTSRTIPLVALEPRTQRPRIVDAET